MTASQTLNTYQITAGLDIGNGDSKCKIQINQQKPIYYTVPSVVAYTSGHNIPKTPTPDYLADFVNHMEANISGPGIKPIDEGRMFFGKRAIASGESLKLFDINNHIAKSADSLSNILIDGILAASALASYFAENDKLPANLSLNVNLAVALPINDYLDNRDTYVNTLKQAKHLVNIRNFANTIPVEITFSRVTVLPEGGAAQLAISTLGPKFIQGAIDLSRKQGAQIDPAYTGEVISKVMNSAIGIDIGDGTVNFPVFTNGEINGEASKTINRGYGTVLDETVTDLQTTDASFENRRDLSEFIKDTNNRNLPAQKEIYDTALKAITEHKKVFARDIRVAFTDIFRKVGKRSHVIWVYGGGATPMQDILEPVLITETKVAGNQNIPLIWMDSQYSRNLNCNGLYIAANSQQ